MIVPSVGRPSLAGTLKSVDSIFVDEIIVSPDGRHAFDSCDAVIMETKLSFPSVSLLQPIEESRMNQRGHPQRNRGMLIAASPWLCFLDDDDVFVEGAFSQIIMGLEGYVPHIFQMRFVNGSGGEEAGSVLWQEPVLRECNVGTPMFVVPNRQMGWWPSVQAGDYRFIEETCRAQGDPVFVETVICEVRPAG